VSWLKKTGASLPRHAKECKQHTNYIPHLLSCVNFSGEEVDIPVARNRYVAGSSESTDGWKYRHDQFNRSII